MKQNLIVIFTAVFLLSIFAVSGPVEAAAPQGCTTSLINYWKLDESGGEIFTDEVGFYDATCTGINCPEPVPGQVSSAQKFINAESDAIDVTADASAPFNWASNASFTIELWMQTPDVSTCSGNQVVIGRDDSSTGLHWWVGCVNGGRAHFNLDDNAGTSAWVNGTTDLTDGLWHHIVAVREESTGAVSIYVDGQLEQSKAGITYASGFDSAVDLNMGWLDLSDGYHFDGILDEIAVYNRALTNTEIQNHSNAGKGYCEPEVLATPATHNFGDVMVGTNSSSMKFNVKNSGTGNLVFGTLVTEGNNNDQFTIQNDNCTGQTITFADQCTVDVIFAPTAEGMINTEISIPSNDPAAPMILLLSGTGTPVPVPDITVTDSVAPVDDLDMPFGGITEGTSSGQTVNITNDGNADLMIGTMAAPASLFEIHSDMCSGKTLSPAQSCTFTVRFSPAAAGIFSDSFDIPSNDPDEAQLTVNVSGTGTPMPVPDITVKDTLTDPFDLQMSFPDTTEGISLFTETVIIENASTATEVLKVGNINLTGSNTLDFILDLNGGTSPCGNAASDIAVGANCTVTVTFSPLSAGVKLANLEIVSDDPDESRITVALSGTGLAAIVNNDPSMPALVSPADGQAGVNTTVDFVWKKSTDPDGDPVNYKLYYCEDLNFAAPGCAPVDVASLHSKGIFYAGMFGSGTGLLFLGMVFAGSAGGRGKITAFIALVAITGLILVSCGSGSGSGGGGSASVNDEVSITESGLNSGTTYHWKVVAEDGNGGAIESGVSSFTTQ